MMYYGLVVEGKHLCFALAPESSLYLNPISCFVSFKFVSFSKLDRATIAKSSLFFFTWQTTAPIGAYKEFHLRESDDGAYYLLLNKLYWYAVLLKTTNCICIFSGILVSKWHFLLKTLVNVAEISSVHSFVDGPLVWSGCRRYCLINPGLCITESHSALPQIPGRPFGQVKSKVKKDYASVQLTAWKVWLLRLFWIHCWFLYYW